MPRVTAEHEEHVRARILDAALRAFTARGLQEATIQDVVRESGLSVGAIYTYFTGKDELLAASCELAMDRELAALAVELAGVATARRKLEVAIRYWFDFLERAPDQAALTIQMFALAPANDALRAILLRRRDRLTTVGALLLREAVAHGELPAGLDVDVFARGFSALLDGVALQAIEEGPTFRRTSAELRVLSFLELLYASGRAGFAVARR